MKLFLLSLFISTSLYALISEFKSDDYQIIIGKHFDDEAYDIIEDHDHSISVIGYTQDFSRQEPKAHSYRNAFDYLSSINTHNGEQLRLVSLDMQAQILLDKSFSLSDYNRGTQILKDAYNRYLLGGYTHNGQMLISSVDINGEEVYLKQFGTANFDRLHALVQLNDGGSVAIGTSQTSRNRHDDIFVQGLGRSDVYLVNFDKYGQIRWKKKYGSPKKDTGKDGVASHDGGFILLSTSEDGNSSEIIAAKINDTGNTSWIKSYPKPGRNKAYKIIQTLQGDYLILGSFENKNAQDNIRLIKIDKEGNTLWEKNYYTNANESLYDLSVDQKGNIIGVGYTQGDAQSDMDALVRYYDHKGIPIWERSFGKDRQDTFRTVTLLHDNSFAIAGFTNSYADKKRQIWVLKINDDGSLVKKQHSITKDIYSDLQGKLMDDSTPVHINKENTYLPSSSTRHKTDNTDVIKHSTSSTTPKNSFHDVALFKDLRITHDGLVFKQGSSTLTAEHKQILERFIPKLIESLLPYKDKIKNIKIKGHTSTEWNAPDTQRYLNNAQLSNNRAMSVLNYSYQIEQIKPQQKWMSEIFTTDGYSYSDLIYLNDKEDKIRSRRVEFEIILK